MKKTLLCITMAFAIIFSNAQTTFVSPLQVDGTNAASGTPMFSIMENSTLSRYVFSADKSGIGSEIYINSGIGRIRTGGSLHFATYNGEAMVIDYLGKVGIGTQTLGSYQLAVAGKIGAWGEVHVYNIGTPFPDYVFEPNYKLPSLNDIEKYIKENKHLSEVPSAKEIEKDGMSLNDMNIILLKKVEELTLHLIEQNKHIEKINKKLEEIKNNK